MLAIHGDDDGIPDKDDLDKDNDGNPDSIKPIEPKKFEAENWLKHGITVFSTKFPFDMFGSIESSNAGFECPTYTFFDRNFELCPIRDFFVVFKYPVIIGFMIWSFQSL